MNDTSISEINCSGPTKVEMMDGFYQEETTA